METSKEGPKDKKCTGCKFHELTKQNKGETIPPDNYCTHQTAPNSLRKLTPLHTGKGAFMGYNDNTPDWCPCKPSLKKIKGTSFLSTKA